MCSSSSSARLARVISGLLFACGIPVNALLDGAVFGGGGAHVGARRQAQRTQTNTHRSGPFWGESEKGGMYIAYTCIDAPSLIREERLQTQTRSACRTNNALMC